MLATRRNVVVSLALAAAVGCGGGSSSKPQFTGETGTSWEKLAKETIASPGFSDYSPEGSSSFYSLEDATLRRYDATAATWTTLATAPVSFDDWAGTAWVGDNLYLIHNNAVYAYSISGDSWSKLLDTGVPANNAAMTAHDDSGNLWTVESASPYRIVKYDGAANSITTYESGFPGTDEARVAWDAKTSKLFIALGYDMPQLYAFDPAAATVTPKAGAPAVGGGAGEGMGDAFCSDRWGHLYAIADTGCSDSASMFQYDTEADTWKAIPDVPFANHGCNGACTVTDDGWLYFVRGEGGAFARLQLMKD